MMQQQSEPSQCSVRSAVRQWHVQRTRTFVSCLLNSSSSSASPAPLPAFFWAEPRTISSSRSAALRTVFPLGYLIKLFFLLGLFVELLFVLHLESITAAQASSASTSTRHLLAKLLCIALLSSVFSANNLFLLVNEAIFHLIQHTALSTRTSRNVSAVASLPGSSTHTALARAECTADGSSREVESSERRTLSMW